MLALAKQYYEKYVTGFWEQRFAIITLGVISALYFGMLGVAWAVTGEFTRWGGHFLQFLGVNTDAYSYLKLVRFAGTPLTRVDGVLVLGMFAGALISALLGQNVKIRIPTGKRIFQALLGGIIAGFGTRMAMGCNLAALFTGIPQLSFHTWLFTIGTIAGTFYGLKISMHPWMMGNPKLTVAKALAPEPENPVYYRIQPYLGIAGFALLASYLVYLGGNGYPSNLLLAVVFGFAFGFLIQKGQVCFTSAFRDLWLVGRANTAKALILGIAVQTIITAAFLAKGMNPNVIWWAGPGALLGGVLFGVGIVIAGGCETGWMYRSMEGQLHFWFVGLGNVIGATVLTLAWDGGVFPYLVQPFPRVDLAKYFGMPVALALTALMLAALYFWADWRQTLDNTLLARRVKREG
ncbi:MAG: selenium metabolism membrane protein YedE/FdhT [Negativicutes bacterium]|nr:selenium metabolism membrane protein YedE/FdhT [Negativicutes bacterium]